MTRLYLGLTLPGAGLPGDTSVPMPGLLECRGDELRMGSNGLYLRAGDLRPTAWWTEAGMQPLPDLPPLEFRGLNAGQRQQSRQFFDALEAAVPSLKEHRGLGSTGRWMPTIAATASETAPSMFACFHLVQLGEPGAMYVHYHDESVPLASTRPGLCELLQALNDGNSRHGQRLDALRPALGDECWYTKWRPDVEMERKFTFRGIPDTWSLLHTLHREITRSSASGFVPELDREIQVWDYEQHIFEVLGANSESGYIAYIPQADGHMTVKRKWFIENSEIRRESLWVDHQLQLCDIDAHVRTLTAEHTRRLPGYRRKRFDAQFESLHTGNIFGIYMDICRTLDGRDSFTQCEIEYCRTRTFGDIRLVEQDFNHFSTYVAAQFERLGVAFQQDLYSKLDFVRSIADSPAAREAA
ncbi:hypothetical protein OU995_19085 [Roseateles sp. SL47]|uniref:hypothetical protein n=1 Tax=Roseateles sp. SL47 TaxID=2995138 RepID=UPI00226FE42A|nr:hypothetical protein [Roseateles sp. SL47]WAC71674.1 hypothetical protein OU995_19085 [Roseateles sp. SL47]